MLFGAISRLIPFHFKPRRLDFSIFASAFAPESWIEFIRRSKYCSVQLSIAFSENSRQPFRTSKERTFKGL